MIEYKAEQSFLMGIDGRTATGIFAVHGNVDDGMDRSYPGVFGDYKVGGRSRAVYLWQHDSEQPPTAKIDRIFEVGRADLPKAVLDYAPMASGGTAVTRTYLSTPRADEVLAGLVSGAISEMSYAYDPQDYKFTTESDRTIRELYRSDLYDISDVNWGMNPATSADGSKRRPIQGEHAAVLAAVADYTERSKALATLRAKEGRVLSGESRKRIEAAVEAMQNAHAALTELLAATEPGKSAQRKTQDVYAEWQAIQRRITVLGV